MHGDRGNVLQQGLLFTTNCMIATTVCDLTVACCCTATAMQYDIQENSAALVVIYPSGGGQGHTAWKYLLSTHVGLSAKQVPDLRHVKSRWVLFRASNPCYMLSAVSAQITE